MSISYWCGSPKNRQKNVSLQKGGTASYAQWWTVYQPHQAYRIICAGLLFRRQAMIQFKIQAQKHHERLCCRILSCKSRKISPLRDVLPPWMCEKIREWRQRLFELPENWFQVPTGLSSICEAQEFITYNDLAIDIRMITNREFKDYGLIYVVACFKIHMFLQVPTI